MGARVLNPGLSTTIQDLGRPGYFHLGIPVGGAMDRLAMRAANLLVGNDEGAAGLEAVFIGPKLEFTKDALVAVTGADMPAKVDGVSQPGWTAFKVKAGRTMVLALTNRAGLATSFHLHGHHFRLLDRLDDGWKPFWLDTLAIEPGNTQRIAFAATYPGRWLIESTATRWAGPRLVRWYSVE